MKLSCLVDNAVQPHSSFWGEHGLAFLIESPDGRVLFDTGAGGEVLSHNLKAAGVEPGSISALALSHAHHDHSGGLPVLLEQRPGLRICANADLLRERFSRRDGNMKPIGLPPGVANMHQQVNLHLSTAPHTILPGIWTTGEIFPRVEPEGRSPHHFVRQGDGWAPDPYRDDMALVIKAPAGLVLLCGCCHAGLLNTLSHVQRAFQEPITAIIGGTHLIGADTDYLERVSKILVETESVRALYLNHCTGETALAFLLLRLGPQTVHSCPAGTQLDLEEWQ